MPPAAQIKAPTATLSSALADRLQPALARAAECAASVDRDSRFPEQAFEELRKESLLGILVPIELGGEGATFREVADVCYRLGQACSATAMIYAMHQVKVACLVRHMGSSAALRDLLRRLAAEQLLLASSTTEGTAGGNVRASEAPVAVLGERFTLERRATCISYGADADGVVTTARRTANAAASDQVLVAVLKEDYTLTPIQSWDTLGMRGTCSEGYLLKVSASSGHILETPYEQIHLETMVPSAHLFWGSVWAGIAAAATQRAQAFVRDVVRKSGGQMPPGAVNLTTAMNSLRSLRAQLHSALERFESIAEDRRALRAIDFQSMITLTKVQVSDLAAATVMSALRVCGLSGYRNDGEFSVARHLRDVLSSPIMIHNDRILANLATPVLLAEVPSSLE